MTNIIPQKISAGLTFDVLANLSAYPAPTWALSVILRGPAVINLTATAEGTQHRIKKEATDTALWLPGFYIYDVRASSAGRVDRVEGGSLEILPDLSAMTAPHDGRSQARITLDAIEAVIAKRATRDQERYKINERELWRTPIADLLKLRGYYASLVRAEDARSRGASLWGAAVRVRF